MEGTPKDLLQIEDGAFTSLVDELGDEGLILLK
jgi:hypothetical protein